jgi:hypothetical protein
LTAGLFQEWAGPFEKARIFQNDKQLDGVLRVLRDAHAEWAQ